jgi:hypothetical protein
LIFIAELARLSESSAFPLRSIPLFFSTFIKVFNIKALSAIKRAVLDDVKDEFKICIAGINCASKSNNIVARALI